jgi:hypothetical protein
MIRRDADPVLSALLPQQVEHLRLFRHVARLSGPVVIGGRDRHKS